MLKNINFFIVCLFISLFFYQIIFKMVEEHPRDVGHEMDELSIVYGDESLPRLYENSRISSDQLPGQKGLFVSVLNSVCFSRSLLIDTAFPCVVRQC